MSEFFNTEKRVSSSLYYVHFLYSLRLMDKITGSDLVSTNLIKNKVWTTTQHKVAIFCQKKYETKLETKAIRETNQATTKKTNTTEEQKYNDENVTEHINQTTRRCNDNLKKNWEPHSYVDKLSCNLQRQLVMTL